MCSCFSDAKNESGSILEDFTFSRVDQPKVYYVFVTSKFAKVVHFDVGFQNRFDLIACKFLIGVVEGIFANLKIY